jgi:hypothetical protein
VEPCFEGSSVTAPKVSSSFTKIDDEFKKTLFSMMQELQFALQGGQQMENEVQVPETEVVEETPAVEVEQFTETVPAEVSAEEVATEPVEETAENDFAASKKKEEEENNETPSNDEEKEEPSEEEEDEKKKHFAKEEEEEEKKEEEKSQENSDAPTDDDKKEEEENKKKYELLETEFAALQEQYSELKVKYDELVAFKAQIEDAKKDEMISRFCFLSDEDKKEVIENKSKYSVEDIEAKLSVICVRNKVNFNLDDNSKNDINTDEPVTTFTVENTGSSTPAYITAILNNRKN